MPAAPVSVHGVVFDILVRSENGVAADVQRPAFAQLGFGAAAFAHFARRGHGLACPAVARVASEGWWARQDCRLSIKTDT